MNPRILTWSKVKQEETDDEGPACPGPSSGGRMAEIGSSAEGETEDDCISSECELENE